MCVGCVYVQSTMQVTYESPGYPSHTVKAAGRTKPSRAEQTTDELLSNSSLPLGCPMMDNLRLATLQAD